MKSIDRYVNIGINLHIQEWKIAAQEAPQKEQRPFLLVHGLSSNANTWNEVAPLLAKAGHPVVTVDQRGHGLSDKPDDGYDFATITSDLHKLITALGWERPILAGQSWGGNVMLEFGARFPGVTDRLIFVDGGFLNLQQRGSWEEVEQALRPPHLVGTPRATMKQWMQAGHPNWNDIGIEATLSNFETLPDGTIRPWLTLEHHLKILRAMYDQRLDELYAQVQEPVLICVADDGSEWAQSKRAQVKFAEAGLQDVEVVWFKDAAHDIHVDKPAELAAQFLAFAQNTGRV